MLRAVRRIPRSVGGTLSASIRHKSTGVKFPAAETVVTKFSFPGRTHSISSLLTEAPTLETSQRKVTLQGWIHKKPRKVSKNLTFASLRDTNGDIIQLVDSNSPSVLRSMKPESAVVVEGVVAKQRTDKEGVFDLVVSSSSVLNEANEKGSQLTLGDTKDWPAEYRYLQLRQPQLQAALRLRANAMKTSRSVLDSLGFTEVETPLLFKSTPEGAREFLVPTRKRNLMYALPQSPQQYKQLLMASGVHRYYQLAKCFRDEDLRQDRQPEFTQVDMEMAFANGADVREVVEKLVLNIFADTVNKNVYTLDADGNLVKQSTFNPMTFNEALGKYGIDKPDLRYTCAITDVSEHAISPNEDFPVCEILHITKEDAPESLDFLSEARLYTNRVPDVIRITEENVSSWNQQVSQFKLDKALPVSVGDVVLASTRQTTSYENPTPLGRARQLLIKEYPERWRRQLASGEQLPTIEDTFVASWVIDFPLFSPSSVDSDPEKAQPFPKFDYTQIVASHHPFTMAVLEDYPLLETDPLKARGQHYDLVLNGVEVGGGSTRVHDSQLQNYIFKEIMKIPNSEKLFGHLLRAFDVGCPPHAGFAIGFDRLVAMLAGYSSIRDVIAFPKTITGADPMIGSPSAATSAQLAPYHVRVAPKENNN
ncbi:Aspartate--tRNA ligase [Yarrowia sp. C11]|nr:Aspartate--tRNA ligase [Yarrowia sp. E02]KAG5371488.1 Aspartate--tRNA ligase [Yarrowia sp. C11]